MVARLYLQDAKPIRTFFAEWREAKGLTQQELAERMGTTAATVSRIETGERDWGKGFLEAFAFVVGTPYPTDAITRGPGDPLPHDTGPIQGPDEIKGTLDRIAGLTDDDRSVLLSIILKDIKFNNVSREQAESHDQSAPSSSHRASKPSHTR